ncbi:DUF2862 domain-containing protein [Synechococcus sp. CS-1325]|uniref:cytochrome b6f subunit PetP n=1 Tax=unclassified Synechococcus TaxID=2626047 RepID=UPI000DB15219|nr:MULTISPECIES: DUF2862 domain-containing protein [unclassified Synechococcus]PZU99533.1 MAG: cytochrome B6 [Cyanobium sp.]MCT0200775.1 DUF2862 domain-containing protein [Synechococcus sp. CS-1325]MCT0212351.1 DUF2862 domain-containing protein [Synechococcus sp. CS-1326]MCT0230556.1 DUF2862 domain-containing protein [Synechococcus sp. CS-1324]MCT0234236.1 DUF2862 domain-containing protein [Synechococcus sp. CS-1327]
MTQALTPGSITVGSRVKITRVRDRIPADLVEVLKKDASGTVSGYKMTDGSGIGVVVELSDGSSGWFFDDEIAPA